MDKLFSNIQQNLQQNDKKSVLQNQQLNQDKIMDLLEKSSEAIMCGPTCQKSKITDELKQKYLDAQTNLQTAPIKLEQTKKNYYIYKDGRPYYDNMLEEELVKKSEKIKELLSESFEDEVSSAKTMNNYLNTAIINSNYTKELLNSYTEKNQELKLILRNRKGDILTNDRKTYYETDALDRLQMWYKLWWYVYYILVIVLSIALFVSQNNLGIVAKIVISGLLITYPYYIDFVIRWIMGVFMGIFSNLPKNVYNDL